MTELQAVLWDMDGTLIDSEPFWFRAQRSLMEDHGLRWTAADAAEMVGSPLASLAEVMRSRGVDLTSDQIVTRLNDEVVAQLAIEIPWQPGARELLLASQRAGLRNALVTMSYRRMAQHVIDDVGVFEAVVTSEDVSRGKPHPEPYRTALTALGIEADAAIALEDSVPGVASAMSAGIVTIAVERHVSLAEVGGHLRTTEFATLEVDDLRRIHRTHTPAVA